MKKQFLIKILKDGTYQTPKHWKSYGEGMGSEVFPVFMDTTISEFRQEEKYFDSEEDALVALIAYEEVCNSDGLNHTKHNFSWHDDYVIVPVYRIE